MGEEPGGELAEALADHLVVIAGPGVASDPDGRRRPEIGMGGCRLLISS